MHVWRISRIAHTGLDGEGARLFGGRWNSRGIPVVYTASRLSLAALEYLVHIDPEDAPDDLVASCLRIPDGASEVSVGPDDLPQQWRQTPAPAECQRMGDHWARSGEHLLLRVPSVLVPEETNVLVNPLHPDASGVRMSASRPFSFDLRLLGKGGPTQSR